MNNYEHNMSTPKIVREKLCKQQSNINQLSLQKHINQEQRQGTKNLGCLNPLLNSSSIIHLFLSQISVENDKFMRQRFNMPQIKQSSYDAKFLVNLIAIEHFNPVSKF